MPTTGSWRPGPGRPQAGPAYGTAPRFTHMRNEGVACPNTCAVMYAAVGRGDRQFKLVVHIRGTPNKRVSQGRGNPALSLRRADYRRYARPAQQAVRPGYRALTARHVRSVRHWSLSVSKPGPFKSGSGGRDLAGLRAAAVIHISTAPVVHSRAGADQRIYPNYPQSCAQGVILAGQRLQASMSQRRKPVIPRHPSCRAGREVTFMRIAC
jgi:hypothetical protein